MNSSQELSQEEIVELKEKVAEADRLYVRASFPRNYESDFVKNYSIDKQRGINLYAAYSDDELNNIALERTRQMNGKFKDFYLFGIYHEYFKTRHITWLSAKKFVGASPDVGGDEKYFRALEKLDPNTWFTKSLYQLFKASFLSHISEIQRAANQAKKMLQVHHRWSFPDIQRMTKIMSIDALNRRLGFSGYEGRPVFDCTQETAAVREIAAKLGHEPNLSEIPDKIGIMLWLAGGDKQGVRELISAASQMPAAGAELAPAEEAEVPAAADAEPADATPATPDAEPQDHDGAPKAEARSRGFVAMFKRKISRV